MLLSANAAFAAPTIGSANGTVTSTSAGFDTVQISTTTPGAYAVPPGGGAITTWSTLAGPRTGPVGLQVWRRTLTPGTYVLVGASPLVTLTGGMLNTITLDKAIPVLEGDLLGLRIEGIATYGLYTSSATDVYGSFQRLNPNPLGGTIDAFGANTFFQLDVAATVEAVTPPPPPPPPPPSGCDSTGNSANTVADTSASVAIDASTAAPADTSNVDSIDRSTKDSSDQSTKDSSDQSKKDKPAKDLSTGGDNCVQ